MLNKESTFSGLNPGELFLGIAEDGLPVKVDLKEAIDPIFIITQATKSRTHDLLTLAASSCRQSSPDWQLTVVTEDPSAWQETNPDFVMTPGDPRLADRLAEMVSQKDGHNLLIFEGLEHDGQMPKEAKPFLDTLLKDGDRFGKTQIIASVYLDQMPAERIGQLITTYPEGQFIWEKAQLELIIANDLGPCEFLAPGMGEDGQTLKFSLPKI